MVWNLGRKQKNNGRGSASSNSAHLPDFAFFPPVAPLPLSEAIRQLPDEYKRVITKPYTETFQIAAVQAGWGIVWVQLIGYAVISALLGFVGTLLSFLTSASGLSGTGVLRALVLGTSLIIVVPLLFFAIMGLLFLLSKMFGGQGGFVQQSYTTLLFFVPFGIALSILGLIPFVGGFLSAIAGALLFLYSLLLEILALMAIHRLGAGKATGAVVILGLIFIPIALIALSLWTFFVSSLFH